MCCIDSENELEEQQGATSKGRSDLLASSEVINQLKVVSTFQSKGHFPEMDRLPGLNSSDILRTLLI